MSSLGISGKIALLKRRLETAEDVLEATAQTLRKTGTKVHTVVECSATWHGVLNVCCRKLSCVFVGNFLIVRGCVPHNAAICARVCSK